MKKEGRIGGGILTIKRETKFPTEMMKPPYFNKVV
jgi:hypothetical protein